MQVLLLLELLLLLAGEGQIGGDCLRAGEAERRGRRQGLLADQAAVGLVVGEVLVGQADQLLADIVHAGFFAVGVRLLQVLGHLRELVGAEVAVRAGVVDGLCQKQL